jgi:ubiquinone biosynthesis protein
MGYGAEVHIDLTLGELLFVGLPFAVAVGWLSGRVLGVRRGWVRALVAGAVGWFFGLVMAAVIQGTADLGDTWFLTLSFGLLAAMVVSIVLDVVVRPRDRRHRRATHVLLHPVKAVQRRFAPLGRFREIAHHARKRGLTGLRFASTSAMATPEFARRLRLTLEDCGGMFVKFGQIASTRTDLLPEALTTELADLQASVRPVPADDIRAVIETELGAAVEEEFASFDWEPLAAASIGQTHRAVLRDGQKVVVKVQRPGIEDTVNRDAAVLRMAASVLERRVEAARQVGLKGLADELIGSLQRELDYTQEAANAAAFRERRRDDDGVSAPAALPAYSTRRVLVMEEIDGTTVADRAAVAESGVSPPVLARRLLLSFLDQVLRDGTYHADPHPGNVFIDRHGVLWLLDFGAVGHLDPLMLEALQQMAMGLELHDPVVLARAVRQASGRDEAVDSRALEADIGILLSEGIASGSFDPATMTQLLEVMQRHGLQPPRALTVLSRALLTLEGTLRTIDPELVLGQEARELLPQLADRQEGLVHEQLQKELFRALPALRTLPSHTEAIASQLRAGRLTTRTERYAGADRAVVDTWVDRIMFAAVGAIGLLSSALLLVAAAASPQEGIRDTLQAVGFFGLVIASVMQMRTIAQVLRRAGAPDRDGGTRV